MASCGGGVFPSSSQCNLQTVSPADSKLVISCGGGASNGGTTLPVCKRGGGGGKQPILSQTFVPVTSPKFSQGIARSTGSPRAHRSTLPGKEKLRPPPSSVLLFSALLVVYLGGDFALSF